MLKLTYEEVEKWKDLIPEPDIRRVDVHYGDAGPWKRTWIYLTAPNQFEIRSDWKMKIPPDEQEVVIKKGFIYDGASIPFFARPILTSFGPLHRGGGIHDYGYRFNYLRDWEGNKIYVDAGQKFFDDLFRTVGSHTSHLRGLATLAWSAVRMFGKVSWDKHRKNNLTDDYLYERPDSIEIPVIKVDEEIEAKIDAHIINN